MDAGCSLETNLDLSNFTDPEDWRSSGCWGYSSIDGCINEFEDNMIPSKGFIEG